MLAWAEGEELAVAVIGLGSNLLVADEGYDGVALRLEGALAAIEIDGIDVRCGGGASLAAVVRRCTEAALTGIEFGCAIPGTVGGAVRMNAGAYGSEIRDVLSSADVVSADGVRQRRPARARSELPALQRARHRRSSPRPSSQLEHGARDEIRARVRDMQRRRSESQPRKARTFGSVFKNPDEGPGAGALIEACGLKGHVIGGASHLQRARQLHRERRRCELGRRRRAGLARPALRARALRGRSGARSGAARARHPGLSPPIWVAGGAAGAPKRGACSTYSIRRRAAAVVAAAVICAAAAGAVELGYLWLKGSGVFQLRSVAVRGGTRERARGRARCGCARRGGSFAARALAGDASPATIEQVPTIRLASVDRDFPHTLRIHIVPERAVALAQGAGHYRSLVAASGRVLRVFERQDVVPALPRIWTNRERPIPGGSIRATPALAALDALAARPPDFSAHVANVKMDPDRGIVMRLRGGLDIVLGPPLQLQQKLLAAAWVLHRYPTSADRAQLVYADVSAPDAARGHAASADTRTTAGLGEHCQAGRQWLPNRSEWRMMRAGMHACIVNNGLVALDAASPSELSERG